RPQGVERNDLGRGVSTARVCTETVWRCPASIYTWRVCGIRLGIYSSGSEQAQRLLFAHTNAGDVTSLLEHFFDTSVGEKKTASSSRTISGQTGLPPQHILFLSDAERDLDAAALTGFRTPTSFDLAPMRASIIPYIQTSRTSF